MWNFTLASSSIAKVAEFVFILKSISSDEFNWLEEFEVVDIFLGLLSSSKSVDDESKFGIDTRLAIDTELVVADMLLLLVLIDFKSSEDFVDRCNSRSLKSDNFSILNKIGVVASSFGGV